MTDDGWDSDDDLDLDDVDVDADEPLPPPQKTNDDGEGSGDDDNDGWDMDDDHLGYDDLDSSSYSSGPGRPPPVEATAAVASAPPPPPAQAQAVAVTSAASDAAAEVTEDDNDESGTGWDLDDDGLEGLDSPPPSPVRRETPAPSASAVAPPVTIDPLVASEDKQQPPIDHNFVGAVENDEHDEDKDDAVVSPPAGGGDGSPTEEERDEGSLADNAADPPPPRPSSLLLLSPAAAGPIQPPPDSGRVAAMELGAGGWWEETPRKVGDDGNDDINVVDEAEDTIAAAPPEPPLPEEPIDEEQTAPIASAPAPPQPAAPMDGEDPSSIDEDEEDIQEEYDDPAFEPPAGLASFVAGAARAMDEGVTSFLRLAAPPAAAPYENDYDDVQIEGTTNDEEGDEGGWDQDDSFDFDDDGGDEEGADDGEMIEAVTGRVVDDAAVSAAVDTGSVDGDPPHRPVAQSTVESASEAKDLAMAELPTPSKRPDGFARVDTSELEVAEWGVDADDDIKGTMTGKEMTKEVEGVVELDGWDQEESFDFGDDDDVVGEGGAGVNGTRDVAGASEQASHQLPTPCGGDESRESVGDAKDLASAELPTSKRPDGFASVDTGELEAAESGGNVDVNIGGEKIHFGEANVDDVEEGEEEANGWDQEESLNHGDDSMEEVRSNNYVTVAADQDAAADRALDLRVEVSESERGKTRDVAGASDLSAMEQKPYQPPAPFGDDESRESGGDAKDLASAELPTSKRPDGFARVDTVELEVAESGGNVDINIGGEKVHFGEANVEDLEEEANGWDQEESLNLGDDSMREVRIDNNVTGAADQDAADRASDLRVEVLESGRGDTGDEAKDLALAVLTTSKRPDGFARVDTGELEVAESGGDAYIDVGEMVRDAKEYGRGEGESDFAGDNKDKDNPKLDRLDDEKFAAAVDADQAVHQPYAESCIADEDAKGLAPAMLPMSDGADSFARVDTAELDAAELRSEASGSFGGEKSNDEREETSENCVASLELGLGHSSNTLDDKWAECPCLERIMKLEDADDESSGAVVAKLTPDGKLVKVDYDKLLRNEVTKRQLLQKHVSACERTIKGLEYKVEQDAAVFEANSSEVGAMFKKLEEEKEALEAEVEELRSASTKVPRSSTVECEDSTLRSKVTLLQEELDAKACELDVGRTNLAEVERRLDDAETRFQTLEAENRALKIDLSAAKDTAETTVRERADIESMAEQYKAQIDELRNALDATGVSIDETERLTSEVASLRYELDSERNEREGDVAKISSLESRLGDADGRLLSCQGEKETLKAEVTDAREALSRTNVEKAALESMAEQYKAQINELRNSLDATGVSIDETEKLTSEVASLRYELDVERSEREDDAAKISSLESRLSDAEERLLSCQGEKETLKAEVTDAREAASKTSMEKAALESMAEQYKVQIDELHNALDATDVPIDVAERLESEVTSLKDELEAKGSELMETNAKVADLVAKLADATKQLLTSKEERTVEADGYMQQCDTLRSKNGALTEELSNLQPVVKTLQEQKDALEMKVSLYETQIDDLKCSVATMQAADRYAERLKDELDVFHGETSAKTEELQKKVRDSEGRLAALTAEDTARDEQNAHLVEMLKGEIAALSAILSDKDEQDAACTLKQMHRDMFEIQTTNGVLTKEKDELESALERTKRDHAAEARAMSDKMSFLEQKIQSLEKEKEELELKHQASMDDVSSLVGERGALRAEVSSRDENNNALKAQIKELTGERNDLIHYKDTCAKLQEKVALAEHDHRTLHEKKIHHEEMSNQLRDDISVLTKERDEIASQREYLSSRLSELEGKLAVVDATTPDIGQLGSDHDAEMIANLQGQIESYEKEVKRLTKENQDLLSRCHQLESSFQTLQEEMRMKEEDSVQRYKNDIAFLTEERSAISSQRDGLQSRCSELEEKLRGLESENSRLAFETQTKEETIRQLKEEATNIRKMKEKYASEKEERESRCEELQCQVYRLENTELSLEEQLRSSQEKEGSLKAEIVSLNEQRERLEGENEELLVQLGLLTQTQQQERDAYDDLVKERQDLLERIDELELSNLGGQEISGDNGETKSRTLETERRDLPQNDDINQYVEQIKESREQISSLEEALESKENEVDNLKRAQQVARRAYDKLSKEREILVNRIDDLQSTNNGGILTSAADQTGGEVNRDVASPVEQAHSSHDRILYFKDQIHQSEERISHLERVLESKTNELAASQRQVQFQQDTLRDMQSKMDTKESEMRIRTTELEQLVSEKDAELTMLANESSSAKADLANSQELLVVKGKEVADLSVQLEKAREELAQSTRDATATLLGGVSSKQEAESVDFMRKQIISLALALERSELQRADALERVLQERKCNADSLRKLGDSVKRFYATLHK